MFNQMRQIPENVAKEWHDPDEVPRYLQLMQAVKAYNDAKGDLELRQVAWEAEEKAEVLFSEAEGTLLRAIVKGNLLALAALAVGVGAALLHLYVAFAVLAMGLVLLVGASAKAYRGYRAEQAARGLVVQGRLNEKAEAEKELARLHDLAREETSEKERKFRVIEPKPIIEAPETPTLEPTKSAPALAAKA